MHIPDNYLSPATCAALGAAMVPVWTLSARRARAGLEPGRLPMLGIGAAFAFLIMMINVPLPGGTTGHAVGATLLAVLLGPWSACIALSVALFMQALLFGDGGVLAFGANSFNIAFVIPFLGHFLYTFLAGWFRGERARLVCLGVAAYGALAAGTLCAALELGVQPALARDAAGLPLYCPYPLAVSVPAMVLPCLLVGGFVEAFFTVAVYRWLLRVAPDTLRPVPEPRARGAYALLAVLVCAVPAGLLARGTAWGEWKPGAIADVMTGGRRLGFVPWGMANGFKASSLLPDYGVAGLPAWAAYLLSALAGSALLVMLFKLLGPGRKARG